MQTSFIQPENAIYISIKTVVKSQELVDINSLAKVLTALNASFQSLVQAEMNIRYSNPTSGLKKELKQLFSESRLLIADFDFNRFTLTIVPDLSVSKFAYRKLNQLPELKPELFELFSNTVFNTTVFTSAFAEQISKKYNAKERIAIFTPVYEAIINQNDFVFYFGNEPSLINNRWFNTDDKELLTNLIPEQIKKTKEQVETYYQYVKTGEESDLFGKRSKYKKVLIKEALQHDLYPYQLQKLRVNRKNVLFSKQLSAAVAVKDGLYQISFPELQISEKNENRIEAEKAFDAALAVLISRFEKGNWSTDQKTQTLFLKLKELIAEG
ncbi:MAG: hypothetical protein EOP43_02225 [Sphingobacteriaceae bacterium]|nr:MAG: hypothetical protein EOP43_02225 [Sphingobacteriaceae bacterium]